MRFVYSDINFDLLGEIVHRMSGKMLDEFAQEKIFEPLGMHDTHVQAAGIAARPHRADRDRPGDRRAVSRRGARSDARATWAESRGMRDLFSTATDLSRFAEMMLGMGTRDGVRIFSPLTVRKFTSPETPPDQPVLRGLGWDIDSSYSSNRGELFPIGSYGHTGFTGNVHLDRSVHQFLRDSADQFRASEGGEESDRAALASRDDCGRGDWSGCAGRQRGRLQRNAGSAPACGG